ncbi:MAG: hypothetical protein EKK55_02280, partial [Rhodocyclaceae bacterium]
MNPRTLAAFALLFGVGLALDAPVTASLLVAFAAGGVFGPQRSGWASRDTDWLGDLYQGANDVIVKRDALCQTPWFVRDLLFLLALSP